MRDYDPADAYDRQAEDDAWYAHHARIQASLEPCEECGEDRPRDRTKPCPNERAHAGLIALRRHRAHARHDAACHGWHLGQHERRERGTLIARQPGEV